MEDSRADLRREIEGFLLSPVFRSSRIREWPVRKVIPALLFFLFDENPLKKWRAVTLFGAAMAQWADREIDAARSMMRRLLWSLNPESGSIGWGAPEALGETMARHAGLAADFSASLIALIADEELLLESEELQRGVLWGIGRLAEARPDLALKAAPALLPFLASPDAAKRGLAAWASGLLEYPEAALALRTLLRDDALLRIYRDEKLESCRVQDLARAALGRMEREERR